MATVSLQAISDQLRNVLAYAQSVDYDVAASGDVVRTAANQIRQYQVTWTDLLAALPGQTQASIRQFFLYYGINANDYVFVPSTTPPPLPPAPPAFHPPHADFATGPDGKMYADPYMPAEKVKELGLAIGRLMQDNGMSPATATLSILATAGDAYTRILYGIFLSIYTAQGLFPFTGSSNFWQITKDAADAYAASAEGRAAGFRTPSEYATYVRQFEATSPSVQQKKHDFLKDVVLPLAGLAAGAYGLVSSGIFTAGTAVAATSATAGFTAEQLAQAMIIDSYAAGATAAELTTALSTTYGMTAAEAAALVNSAVQTAGTGAFGSSVLTASGAPYVPNLNLPIDNSIATPPETPAMPPAVPSGSSLPLPDLSTVAKVLAPVAATVAKGIFTHANAPAPGTPSNAPPGAFSASPQSWYFVAAAIAAALLLT